MTGRSGVYIAAALVAALVVLSIGAAAGWAVNGWRLSGTIERLKATHARHIATQQQASADVIGRTLLRERELQDRLQEAEHNAQAAKQKLGSQLADSDAAARRLSEQLSDLSGRIGSDTGTAAECAAARQASGVLAELLGEADELAGVYAAEAEGSRIAGTACERRYDSLIPTQP